MSYNGYDPLCLPTSLVEALPYFSTLDPFTLRLNTISFGGLAGSAIIKSCRMPSAEAVKRAHIKADDYRRMYERSVKDPDGFWLEQARTLSWFKAPKVARNFSPMLRGVDSETR